MGNYERKDHFYQQAKSSGLRSRAAYKLEELDKKVKLFRKGQRVIDLGCYPGGWLQVALRKVGPKGAVFGLDLRKVEAVHEASSSAHIFQGDILEPEFREFLKDEITRVDLLLSDMSPSLTGVRFRDAARSAELVEMALNLSGELLKNGGRFVAKVFPGPEADEIFCAMQKDFQKVRRVSLKSSRRTSSELYFVGLGFSSPGSMRGGEDCSQF